MPARSALPDQDIPPERVVPWRHRDRQHRTQLVFGAYHLQSISLHPIPPHRSLHQGLFEYIYPYVIYMYPYTKVCVECISRVNL